MTEASWASLFDRVDVSTDVEAIGEALEEIRSLDRPDPPDRATPPESVEEAATPSPTRVVADADVLAADLLLDGSARQAMDVIRGHSWMSLVLTPRILEDAAAVIDSIAGVEYSAEWRRAIDELAIVVEPDAGGHPALVAAWAGAAMQILTFDPALTAAPAAAKIRARMESSAKTPGAFVATVDPASLFALRHDGGPEQYSGPDRDPRT